MYFVDLIVSVPTPYTTNTVHLSHDGYKNVFKDFSDSEDLDFGSLENHVCRRRARLKLKLRDSTAAVTVKFAL
jgi:hypothetical protein